MPEIVQAHEGSASVQYKLVLSNKRTLTFDTQVVTFIDATLKDNVYGAGTGIHSFATLDPNFLESVKEAMSDANPMMEFRLGFGDPSKMYWLPWQRHIIVKYNAKYEGIATAAGHLMVFETACVFIKMQRANKVMARKGSISDIVKTIAAENDLECVVEPTEGRFMLYQSFEDDTHFITGRLLPRAIKKSGQGGFYFFLRDNVLHFHTPSYQATVWALNYYDTFGTELVVTDYSQQPELWDAGLSGVRIIHYNPVTGQTKEVRSNPAVALRLEDSIYRFSNVKNGEQNVAYHQSYNPPTEANAIAQFKYQRSRQQTFNCKPCISKTITIRHGDLLNLSITQQTSKASSHSGYYYVTGAGHVIKKGAVSSIFTLERGELRGQDQSLSAQNRQEQLVPESKAPGIDLNLQEIQSSEQTKGAGKQSSARTYAVVADATKPLGA